MNRCSKTIAIGLVCIVTAWLSLVSTPKSRAAALEFALDVENIPSGVLLTADGADVVIEAVEYRDGNSPNIVRLLPGMVSYTPLEVTYNRDQDLAQEMFHQGIVDWVGDLQTPNVTLSPRRDVTLVTLAPNGTELERAQLSNAFPIYFNPVTPDLAAGTDRVYELHLVFDGLSVSPVPEPSSILLPAIIVVLWYRRISKR